MNFFGGDETFEEGFGGGDVLLESILILLVFGLNALLCNAELLMDSLESVECVVHGAEPVLYEGHIVRGRIVLSDLLSFIEDSSDGSLVV